MKMQELANQMFDVVQQYINEDMPAGVVMAIDVENLTVEMLPLKGLDSNRYEAFEFDEFMVYGGGEVDPFVDTSIDGEIIEPDEDAIADLAKQYF